MPNKTPEERIADLEKSRDEFKAQLEKIAKDVQGVKKLGNSFASALKKFNKFENDLAELKKAFDKSEEQQRQIVETQKEISETINHLSQTQNTIKESQIKNEKTIKTGKKWEITMLIIIAGLFLYIATKNPTTAQDIAKIVSQSVVQAIQ